MINIQPTLLGKLVKLRPLVPSDLEALVKASSDPKIWEQHPEPRRCERDYFIEKYFQPALQSKGALVFSDEKGEIFGCSRYYNHRPSHKDISVGYTFLSRSHWGHSYNREIKHLMLTHIFQYVDTVLLTAGENNFRSRNAIGKIGGQLLSGEEVRRRGIPVNKSVVFEIRKGNFKGLL